MQQSGPVDTAAARVLGIKPLRPGVPNSTSRYVGLIAARGAHNTNAVQAYGQQVKGHNQQAKARRAKKARARARLG